MAQKIVKKTEQGEPQQKTGGVLFSGIVNVVGESDVGKTTFALECGASPDKIVFIDDDVKGQAIANDLAQAGTPLGKYVNLVSETKGMLETEFHKYCIDLIGSIPDNTYDAIIWDTFTRFEKSFHPWVLTHQKDFRERWSPMGVVHGAEIWIVSQEYESQVLDLLQRKAKLVILTSHMKDENRNGIRTGKRIPDTMKPVLVKSTLRVLLRHSDDGSPVPTGLILKRIGKRMVVDGAIQTISVLPRKVRQLNWKRIGELWDSPIGNRPPSVDELPNEFELSMLDSTVLTDDQRLVMQLALKGVNEQDNDENSGVEVMRNQMLEMRDNGMTTLEIAKEFNVPAKNVIDLLSGR
jgi:hypothetical protein